MDNRNNENSGRNDYVKGLEGIIAAESELCQIDGQNGNLYYRGYSIFELVKKCSFEEVVHLLLKGVLPNHTQMQAFQGAIRSERDLPQAALGMARSLPFHLHPMEFLQSVTSCLSGHNGTEHTGTCADMLFLIAQLASAAAARYRFQQGLDRIAPRPDLSHGANFLYVLFGKEPTDSEGEIMDACLILHAEHSMNASTFTARVVASTLSSCHSSVSAAIGALYGSLHGGANERVLAMVDEIGDVSTVESWIDQALAEKRRIMGMGHRVYKAKDPRAVIIQRYLRRLAEEKDQLRDYHILEKIEQVMAHRMQAKGRAIYPNVDFFSGALYRLLGIPTQLYTPIFALSRVAGWVAHIAEQHANNRLFRPRARYVGAPVRAVPPLSDR